MDNSQFYLLRKPRPRIYCLPPPPKKQQQQQQISNPQKISLFYTLNLKKTCKCIKMNPTKKSSFVMPQKVSTKSAFSKMIQLSNPHPLPPPKTTKNNNNNSNNNNTNNNNNNKYTYFNIQNFKSPKMGLAFIYIYM